MAVRVRITSTPFMFLLLCFALLATTLQGVQGEVEVEGPSESECRPYIEKALKKLETGDTQSAEAQDEEDLTHAIITDDTDNQSEEDIEIVTKSSEDVTQEVGDEQEENENESKETDTATAEDDEQSEETGDVQEDKDESDEEKTESEEKQNESTEHIEEASLEIEQHASIEVDAEADDNETDEQKDSIEEQKESVEEEKNDSDQEDSGETATEENATNEEQNEQEETDKSEEHTDETTEQESDEQDNTASAENQSDNAEKDKQEDNDGSDEKQEQDNNNTEENIANTEQEDNTDSAEQNIETESVEEKNTKNSKEKSAEDDNKESTEENDAKDDDKKSAEDNDTKSTEDNDTKSTEDDDKKSIEINSVEAEKTDDEDGSKQENESQEQSEENTDDSTPEEDLTWEIEIPTDLRPREHINEIFDLNDEPTEKQNLILKAADYTLNELKRIYENAIKPLEVLYKYRDLSNRHFGDPEIFSKPLVLFMGPWSGGKSSIINYLLDNEYSQTSLRTGAEPSPAYFNILMWGEEPEVLDGTQLAADWTFSGLQKFGQGLEERLRGLKLPNKLLEKINIVEIPGILEVRKQVSRLFPFNDACQWFIDRADIIFLVYDPSKLDVGPETEAILDQLKGREYQTRIILNKADQVKPEELMRVQGALIWNISPLMSSAQPPIMYTTSLWSRPYEIGAPVRLLQAQEKAFLKDLKTAVDKRIENKIASARRFAVRVRNHAKMVDCYLTTYYNHKSMFGNKKLVAEQIIEHPQDYHIYEGLSTLTNISRYDLPDPDVYRDFFRLNPLYDFQQLSATCTYFRGCPINRLDIAIAYDLPELVGKYKKMIEPTSSSNSNNAESSTKS